MGPLSPAVLIAALLTTTTLAQSNERVWSSVAWILYGDRTPLLSDNPTLTPLGAQQLKTQGSALRDRYLWKSAQSDNGDDNIDNNGLDDVAPISGIERYAINNQQLKVMSTTDSYNVASAMAFFQGLYPPITQAFANATGGMTAATLANGTIVNYPMGGYQYPQIQTASRLFNPNSIYLDGSSHCPSFLQAMSNFPKESTPASNLTTSSSFYASLYPRIFNSSSLPLTQLDFRQAYNIYDYANYQHLHNQKLSPVFAEGEIPRLRDLASSEIRSRHGNLSIPIRSIAGRTLATHTRQLLLDNIRSAGLTNKLNLMFTSFEPFIAFFALSRLDAGASRELYRELPYPGGVMLFELFSTVDTSTGRDGKEEYPEMKDLKVRFLYKNSTAPESRLRVYSLFETGVNFPVLDFGEFEKRMSDVGVKGGEKKEGDKDVEFIGGKGQRRERVGSWELRNGKKLSGMSEGVVEGESGARVEPPTESHLRGGRWAEEYDDDRSLFGREPVKAREF
ncbi:histidine phosphatase superfamily [Triangularia verruculosa]|uniref:Histidine phosphatase superfamily n=1 Tax=Triangularia verruculosa TaxID=2587418 RepID=A0AAN6XRS9_9PEZI|nr:histidine phosphatase superfamily [Triangularia verruculosa]